MSLLMSVLMGILQGIAEFLPISSSGHLALFQAFFGMENFEETQAFFTVLLHLGTLISVFIVYWRDIIEMIYEFFAGIIALFSPKRRTRPLPPMRRMVLMIIVATLPLLLVLPIKDRIDALYGNTFFISCALLATGFLLFFSDRLARGKKNAKTARITDALLVGCGQAVATVPGLSRSGTTIAVGMMLGFERKFAVRFSFLLSLPAVLGANILEIKDVAATADSGMFPIYLAGVVVAAVVGYFAIRLVNMLADKGKFGKFAYYCWAVGIVSLIAGIVKFAL
ncbi:MAG: undecaprenyl-diphosphate phosphatase [Oscillospiraceae bacterium]|nr:undecaprenyl-diphosphate phosphatase [Oscillospiraceae bacterium]